MESRFLLDVIIGKGSSIFQLLSSKDQSLLVWRNTFFILNFGPKRENMVRLDVFYEILLDIINGVALFNIQSNRLSCKSLDEYLHYCVS